MQYAKKAVSWALSVCLMLSLLAGVSLPVRAADKDVINVTCVGDSITAGYKSTNGQSYPTQMQEILGDGYKVTNVGSSGATVMRSLDEAYSKRSPYKKGLESKPDIVILMMGTNDAILGGVNKEENQEKFRKDYLALIEDYEKCGTNPKIILGLPTTSVDPKDEKNNKTNYKEDSRDRNNENYLIPIIKEIAEEKKLQLLDTHTYTGSWVRESGKKNQYLADGLHPNNAGYGKLARYFANAVLGYTEKFTGDMQADTDYSIVAKSSGKAMSIENNSTEGNAKICQMKDEDYESQAWKIVPAVDDDKETKEEDNKDGYYLIMNKYTGKVLNIPNNSKNEGTQVIQWGNNMGENELFQIEATGDGYWTISPKLNPNMCLTISNNSKDDGAAVIQKKSSNGDNQKWELEAIPKVKRLSEGKITITCVGDSITEGVGSSGGMNYPSQLQKLLGDEYWVYNVGVAGTTMQRSLDISYSKTSNYKIGLASEPDVVIMFLGTNDAPRTPNEAKLQEFRSDYKKLIEEYQNCGTDPKIILATYVTTVSDKNNELNDQDAKNEKALIPIVRELAEEYDLQVIDVHNYTGSWTAEKLGAPNAYLSDGLHPNNAGYTRLAKLYANAILGYMEEFTGDLQEDTEYMITSKSSGMAIDVEEQSKDNNAAICQTKTGDSKSQLWKFETAGHGYYQIINQASGKVLAVPNSSTSKGTQLIQTNKGDEDNKQWKIEATGDGHWIIMPKLAQDQAMKVADNSKEEGGKIVQDSNSEAESQQWRLIDVAQEDSNQPKAEYTKLSLEGEVATRESDALVEVAEDSSNGYYVGYIGGDNKGTMTFTVNGEVAGKRTMNIYYASDDANRKMDIVVNDASNQYDFAKTGSWSKPGETPKSIKVSLKQGKNTIKFAGVDGGNCPNVDRIELELTDTEIKDVVTALIDSIPKDITDSAEDQSFIKGVKLAYDQLDADLKKEITNADKLEAALNGEKPPVVDGKNEKDQKAANAVIESIKAIGTVTLDSEEVIKEVREAYDALTEDQKKLVENYDDLETAEATYTQLKTAYDQATDDQKADMEAAKAVINKIAAIGEVTLASESTIKEAKDAYDALTEDQKTLVTNYKDLETAEATYTKLKEEYDQATDEQKADMEAAKAVTDKIAAIGKVTLESESVIKEAREAYDALTEERKKLVTNIKDLESAETAYAELKAEADAKEDKEQADKEAAEAVEDEISAIGVVTLQSGDFIKEAREAYDALTKDQKKLVTNYKVLEAAEATYAQLKKDAEDKQNIVIPDIPDPGKHEEEPKQDNSVKVESITITGDSKKIAVGKSITLTAAVAPATATNKTVTWKSSDTRYATVDANGYVTLKKAAKNKTVTITAIANDGSGKQATYKIKGMSKAVKKVKIQARSKSVLAGRKLSLKAIVTPNLSSKKVNKTVKWISSNENYATVNSKGVVRTKSAGEGKTVKITAIATDGSNKKASIKIFIE